MAGISKNKISLLRKISCEEVALILGMQVTRHKTLCFMHDDHHPSLAFSGPNRERWFCYVCNKGGDVIQFVMDATGLCFVDACQWLGSKFGILLDDFRYDGKPVKVVSVTRKYSAPIVRLFSMEVAQWILNHTSLTETSRNFLFNERKLSEDVVRKLGIVGVDDSRCLVTELQKVFDEKTLVDSGLISQKNGRLYFRIITPCIIFPYFDTKKKLVGIQSRYLGSNEELPRFQFVSSQRSRLFNLPVLAELKSNEDLYISEGITDCLALLSSGRKAVAVPSATILPQMDLVRLAPYKLHMFPDKDEAGQRAFLELRSLFNRYGAVFYKEALPDGAKDFSDYYRMNHEIRES